MSGTFRFKGLCDVSRKVVPRKGSVVGKGPAAGAKQPAVTWPGFLDLVTVIKMIIIKNLCICHDES